MTSYKSKEQLDTKDGEAQLLPKWVNEASKDKDNVWHQSGGLLSMYDQWCVEKQVMTKEKLSRVGTLPKWTYR